MEGHNTWCANVPGSTLIWPVADVAQHVILLLLYLEQNGTGIYDDVNGRPIPGLGLGAGGLDRPRLAGALVWIRPVWRLGAAIRAMALTLAPMLGVMLYRTILTAAERPKVFWYVTVAMLPLNALGNQVPMPGFGRFRLLGQPGPAFRHSVLPLPSV